MNITLFFIPPKFKVQDNAHAHITPMDIFATWR